ncbi:MAG: glycosyltransferase family 4 protein [Candidatus Competibacter sp.]|nr:glycosyltransferase family 4 protein [Candidatus Competibacter sp.]
MKVILLVNSFPDARRRNNSVFNLRTATELAKRVDLTVVVPMAMRPGRPLVAVEHREEFRVIRASGPVVPRAPRLTLRLFRPVVAPSLAPYLNEADIVHSVGVEFAGLLAGALRQNYRYRHLTQLINDLRNLKTPPFARYPYLATLRDNLHGIVCNSRMLEETAHLYFPQIRNVRTAYRGTDLDLFAPEPPGTKAPNGEGRTRFLYLGGLPSYPDRTFGVNTKGGVTLMEAWKRGEEAFHNAGSTLFFGGPCGTSAQARQWVSSLRHPEAVELGGVMPPAQVPAYLRAATMVLIPSLEEGCPNLAFEALASGTPILASDIQPLQEVVVHGECGLTVPAGNAAALKDAMVEYSRPERRQDIDRMGHAARIRAERLFDGRNYARMLVALYEELTAASGQEGHS